MVTAKVIGCSKSKSGGFRKCGHEILLKGGGWLKNGLGKRIITGTSSKRIPVDEGGMLGRVER